MRAKPRRLPVGAEAGDAGVSFRVWAPSRAQVAVVVDGVEYPLRRERSGHFSGFVPNIGAGARYRYRLDDDDAALCPDPASR